MVVTILNSEHSRVFAGLTVPGGRVSVCRIFAGGGGSGAVIDPSVEFDK